MEPIPPFNILVVDDEPPIYDLLVRTGRKEFPEASFVNTRSYQETLDYLKQPGAEPPKVILLDIDLNQTKNGLDLLPVLKAHFEGHVPIVILSGIDTDSNILQAYDTGAVAFTKKPDDLQGWSSYVKGLKEYWYKLARLPKDS